MDNPEMPLCANCNLYYRVNNDIERIEINCRVGLPTAEKVTTRCTNCGHTYECCSVNQCQICACRSVRRRERIHITNTPLF